MRKLLHLITVVIALSVCIHTSAQQYSYSDSWGIEGLELQSQNNTEVEFNYSVHSFAFENVPLNGRSHQKVVLPGHFLPNDAGMPDLPGSGHFVAIPQGATAKVEIIASRIERLTNIEVAPAPVIPWDTEDGPMTVEKNTDVFQANAFYPQQVVKLEQIEQIRGIDVCMLGITPFQYNPVTKELIVYRDLKIRVTFEGGSDQFGEDRLRSRFWDPILKDILVNYESLPEMDYSARQVNGSRDVGCEYLIVSPDGADFQQWADSISLWRNKEGILTDVVTLTEIGGNSAPILENYFNNAYNTWDIVPDAVLLIGDYGTNMNDRIMSPIWDNYCASDNIYADVSGNDMPDMIFARMTARNYDELEVMITKFLNHERTPPTNPDFYDHPITALGWQTERWFQICSETIGGFWKNELGKDPVRINEVYGGNPSTDPWSTAYNTSTVLNYFGVNGLGYIPASPSALGNWWNGNATDVNNAINSGSFMLQHRDHGYEYGWGEPAYSNNSIDGLNNTDLCFIMSINCLTGKYNIGSESFAEKFHRYTHNGQNSGALGLIAASEVSYSFVNDTYVWGFYDYMWPEFMPSYTSEPEPRGLLPAFGNAAGKYFLKQSNWPYNTGNKEVTYNLFHMHGDAFSVLYSEVPVSLTVIHDPVLLGGLDNFTVQADDESFIAISKGYEILGTAESDGTPVNISITPQNPGDTIIVTVTKRNHYRYEMAVEVIPPEGAYCVHDTHVLNDANGNGQADYGEVVLLSIDMKNLGQDDASDVDVTISTTDTYITINDDNEFYGDIAAGTTVGVTDGFEILVAEDVPDLHSVVFTVTATDGTDTWASSFAVQMHAPILSYDEYVIDDQAGNDNGRIDPGETVDLYLTIKNEGTSDAYNLEGVIDCPSEFITINTNNLLYDVISAESDKSVAFSVTASDQTPGGELTQYTFDATGDFNQMVSDSFDIIVGQFPVLILDLDPNNNSGPAMLAAMGDIDLNCDYATAFPEEMILYNSVFLSLGIYYSNHELTTTESTILKDYLEAGGNLYMEGRSTWVDDPQKQIHGMFNVDPQVVSWYEFGEISGVEATFTEDMLFEFGGTQPNKFYFETEDDAFTVLTSEEENRGIVVVNDAGDYKTIASAPAFGELEGDIFPSTQHNLMVQYLEFFGILSTTVGMEEIGNDLNVKVYPNPFTDELNIVLNLENAETLLLEVYNLSGQKVRTIANQSLGAGSHRFVWNGQDEAGNDLDNGVYFYHLTTGNERLTGKVMLVK